MAAAEEATKTKRIGIPIITEPGSVIKHGKDEKQTSSSTSYSYQDLLYGNGTTKGVMGTSMGYTSHGQTKSVSVSNAKSTSSSKPSAAKTSSVSTTKTTSSSSGGVLGWISNTAKSVVNTVKNSVTTTVNKVVNTVKSTAATVKNTVSSAINNTVNSVKSTVSNVVSTVQKAFTTVKTAVATAVDNAINTAKSTVSNVVNTVSAIVGSKQSASSKADNKPVADDGWPTETPEPDYIFPVPIDVQIAEILKDELEIYTGKQPDNDGIRIARDNIKLINQYAGMSNYVTPEMLANAIAIQSNYEWSDAVQEESIRSTDAFGIGQFTYKQMQQYLNQSRILYENGNEDLFKIDEKYICDPIKRKAAPELCYGNDVINPKNNDLAIQMMVMRMEKVLSNELVQKCSDTDKMIFAAIAQQKNNYTIEDIFYADSPYVNYISEDELEVNWKDYFENLMDPQNSSTDPRHREFWLDSIVADGRDYETQFMVQRTINNLEVLSQDENFDINEEVLENMKKLATGKE